MIVDLQHFIRQGAPGWDRLDALVTSLETDVAKRLTLQEAIELQQLYKRASHDLSRLGAFGEEAELKTYLESLVMRSYSQLYGLRGRQYPFKPLQWFTVTIPEVFKRHMKAFSFSAILFLVGGLFGAGVLLLDPSSKAVLMPFPHLLMHPSERVAMEESVDEDAVSGQQATFSAQLMTNNIRVSLLAASLGMSAGLLTAVLLFYNGVILGAVTAEFIAAGESEFLFAWLLPHGAVEIPAILIGGQCGFVIAGAIIGWGDRRRFSQRLRAVGMDLAHLFGAIAILLIWAGVIEAFLSQYHEPFMPYELKIAFGLIEIALLWLWLGRRGSKGEKSPEDPSRQILEAESIP